ncbi:hypothetical protein GCM10017643_37450 [Ancylobacter dichloromethanicus]|uniref:Uncharacterized protein n=1 Tax=Ancylobacter dichloromethanicus TaxID=518825 RepID=A0A9W6JAX4_9HYPH|nr:hypothetical protein GCM10017643_37450 [Ancylobacter dichloromethanicus]
MLAIVKLVVGTNIIAAFRKERTDGGYDADAVRALDLQYEICGCGRHRVDIQPIGRVGWQPQKGDRGRRTKVCGAPDGSSLAV